MSHLRGPIDIQSMTEVELVFDRRPAIHNVLHGYRIAIENESRGVLYFQPFLVAGHMLCLGEKVSKSSLPSSANAEPLEYPPMGSRRGIGMQDQGKGPLSHL